MKGKNDQKQKLHVAILIIVSLSFFVFSDSIPGIKPVSQQKSEWCWAGVCECLVKYWDPTCKKTQAQIASVLVPQGQNHAPDPDSLPLCLTENGKPVNLQVTYLKTTIPWAEVKKEADEKRPFYFFIRWTSGNYHSNVYSGYIKDSTKLKFMDPMNGAFTYRTWEGCFDINGRGKWERTYKTMKGGTILLNNFSFAQAPQFLGIVQNSSQQAGKGVTFLFNDNSNDSRVLRIYNALGACVYESVMDRTVTQLSWGGSNSISSGKYYVLYGHEKSQGFKNTAKNSFTILK